MHPVQQSQDADSGSGLAAGEADHILPQSPVQDTPQVGKSVLLEKLYKGGSEGALRGPKALLEEAKKLGHDHITLQDCKDFLKTQEIYSLYRPARKRYPRNTIMSSYCGEIVQIDIMDMQRNREENDGYLYALLSYDTYSKYLTSYPIKDRKPQSVIDGLTELVSSLPFSIANIYWDQEGSFIGRRVQSWLKANDIANYTTTSQVKAPGVERVIRTIRLAISRFYKLSGTQRWIDFLPQFVNNYNNRDHATTKLKPIDLATDTLLIVPTLKKMGGRKRARSLPPIGSFVRLNKLRGIFDKESRGTWSEEIFRVVGHKVRQSLPMIVLKDLVGEPILGSFYPEEVQSVEWAGEKNVSQIFNTRVRLGVKEYQVNYIGWPSKHREWTPHVPEALKDSA